MDEIYRRCHGSCGQWMFSAEDHVLVALSWRATLAAPLNVGVSSLLNTVMLIWYSCLLLVCESICLHEPLFCERPPAHRGSSLLFQ